MFHRESASVVPSRCDALRAKLAAMSIYDIEANSLDGKPNALAPFAGQVTLIVNVASQCGLTPQYETLEKLYETYRAKGFSVLGFPCNDFGGQEPGTPEQIQQFCTSRYDVKFPLFEKISVKAGPNQSPVYTALEKETQQLPTWNFGKYLVGRDGKVIQFFASKVAPDDPALVSAVTKALG